MLAWRGTNFCTNRVVGILFSQLANLLEVLSSRGEIEVWKAVGGSIIGDTKRHYSVLSHVEASQVSLLVVHVDHSRLVESQGLADWGKEWVECLQRRLLLDWGNVPDPVTSSE